MKLPEAIDSPDLGEYGYGKGSSGFTMINFILLAIAAIRQFKINN